MFNRSSFSSHVFFKAIGKIGNLMLTFSHNHNPTPTQFHFNYRSHDIDIKQHIDHELELVSTSLKEMIESKRLYQLNTIEKDSVIKKLMEKNSRVKAYYLEFNENLFEVYDESSMNKIDSLTPEEIIKSQNIMANISEEEYLRIITDHTS
jgi:hypothetical protein